MSYPSTHDIEKCAKPPSQGGLSAKDLRQLAKEMGINPTGLKKDQLCQKIKGKLGKAAGPAAAQPKKTVPAKKLDHVYQVYHANLEWIGEEPSDPPVIGIVFDSYQKALKYATEWVIEGLGEEYVIPVSDRKDIDKQDYQLIGTNEEFEYYWIIKHKVN